ncbi:MAG: hypothetical protein JXR70_11270 [Spirochaetales bacterium]|nr:hypothetical protein [Spirochaetales bacterium]
MSWLFLIFLDLFFFAFVWLMDVAWNKALGIGITVSHFFKNGSLKPSGTVISVAEGFEAQRSYGKPGLKAPGLIRQRPKYLQQTNSFMAL